MKTKQFKCGCGFKTTDGKEFRTHVFLQGKKDGKGKHWSVKAKVRKTVTQPAVTLAVSPRMATAIERSLIDEANSRTAQVPVTVTSVKNTTGPASKPFPWPWVLLGLLIVALAGVIVARVLLG